MNQFLVHELRETFIALRDALDKLEAGIPRGELLIAASNLMVAERLERADKLFRQPRARSS